MEVNLRNKSTDEAETAFVKESSVLKNKGDEVMVDFGDSVIVEGDFLLGSNIGSDTIQNLVVRSSFRMYDGNVDGDGRDGVADLEIRTMSSTVVVTIFSRFVANFEGVPLKDLTKSIFDERMTSREVKRCGLATRVDVGAETSSSLHDSVAFATELSTNFTDKIIRNDVASEAESENVFLVQELINESV